MKPWITNEAVTIRAHYRGAYTTVNTANIVMTTNHKDGIPAGGNDTRYFPMFSRFQTKAAIDAFKRQNPDYYDNLHDAVDHAAALRTWLLEYKISKGSDAKGRAPESSYRAELIAVNETDADSALQEALSSSDRPDFCNEALDSSLLDEMLEPFGAEAPSGRARNIFLSEAGFSKFPKREHDGKAKNIWSKRPEMFLEETGKQDNAAIVAWLNQKRLKGSGSGSQWAAQRPRVDAMVVREDPFASHHRFVLLADAEA